MSRGKFFSRHSVVKTDDLYFVDAAVVSWPHVSDVERRCYRQ